MSKPTKTPEELRDSKTKTATIAGILFLGMLAGLGLWGVLVLSGVIISF